MTISNPSVSVIVPTFNSGEILDRCLLSIKQNKSKYSYEVIVVDAGSCDDTLAIARRHAHKVIAGTPRTINRNKGIDVSEGAIICFTDSDCIVPPDWIDTLVDQLLRLNTEDRAVVGVGGGNVPLLENPSLEELAVARAMRSPFISFKARNTAAYKALCQVTHNPPMNSACFRSVVQEMGGFVEQSGYPEDLDLDARILMRGYKLYFIPNLVVHHKHKSSYSKFRSQMLDFGRKRVRVNRKHRHISRFYHYGPMLLCLMLYSPLLFIPVLMALTNGLYTVLRDREIRLFLPVTRLTLSFYRSYGMGELQAMRDKERHQ